MARRGDGLYQRGKTWRLDFTHEGQRHAVRLGRGITRTVARELAQVKRAEILKGAVGIGPAKRTTPPTTFGQAVARYLQAKARKRTIEQDRRHLTAFVAAFGAATPLAEITAARLSAWRDEKLAATCARTGAVYSPAAINRPLGTLRHLLTLATTEWEMLASAPRIKPVKERQGRVRWLTPNEEARLIQACREKRTLFPLVDIVVVALETGMRKGELLGLTWDRVDLSRGVIQLEITKTDRRREIPMRAAVYEILAAMPEPRRGRVWARQYMDRVFQEAVAAAGIRAFRFHDCRHHFASWFMMRGGDLFSLSKILGHSKVSMTERYAHLAAGHLRTQMEHTDRSGARRAGEFHDGIHATTGIDGDPDR
jgi:integrase